MKRLFPVALVLLACAAGVAGSLIHDSLKTETTVETVNAAPNRAPQAIRIAMIRLEDAARQSRMFNDLKREWEAAQDQLKAQNQKMEEERQTKLAELRRARDDEERMSIRIEIQTIEQAQEAAGKEQQKYLASLLNLYQKDVLKMVMEEIDGFVRREGYDIVLQDYDARTDEADFFSGGAYAQTLMSKPVLLAPGIKDKKNAYVVDITDAIIDLVKDKVVARRDGSTPNQD